MKTSILIVLLASWLNQLELSAQTNVKSKRKKIPPKVAIPTEAVPAAVPEEILLGKIITDKMTIKIHRMIEVHLSACQKCVGTDQNYKPKPSHKVLLFEISRRNPNTYELNAQVENTTPLYARIVGTDHKEYPCYTVPSLIEIAMEQKQGINEGNAKIYYQLLGSAPPRTEQRAFALAVEMPSDVQPFELIWKKEQMLKCTLNMQNNKFTPAPSLAADKAPATDSKKDFSLAQ
ncbi:hypothetical protein [Xanthocytophaga agilis]|uniref:Uncharacterized protein n=1 Tax=Xanthocytophaga agilis TaxID=3048010 RepID=A0AAE3R308_9BACT|nr:hypothetical protein [Xanthocytophaga agilis]MDJ1499928.1 hypothetical protein [Xanthocytophaga agilis]